MNLSIPECTRVFVLVKLAALALWALPEFEFGGRWPRGPCRMACCTRLTYVLCVCLLCRWWFFSLVLGRAEAKSDQYYWWVHHHWVQNWTKSKELLLWGEVHRRSVWQLHIPWSWSSTERNLAKEVLIDHRHRGWTWSSHDLQLLCFELLEEVVKMQHCCR